MPVVRMPNMITTAQDLRALVTDYLKHPAFTYDVETIGDDRDVPRRNIVTVIALATDGRHDVVPIEFPHGELDWIEHPLTASGLKRRLEWEAAGKEFRPRKGEYSVDLKKATHHWHPAPAHLDRDTAMELLAPLLMSDRLKVGHNLKFDLGSMHKYLGGFPPPPYADTMIAAYLVNSNQAFMDGRHAGRPYALDAVAYRETGYVLQKGVGANVALHPWSAVMRYAGIDAKFTWLAWRMLRRKISKFGLTEVFNLEMGILEVLLDMELEGAPVDRYALSDLNDRLTDRNVGLIQAAEAQVYAAAGRRFSLTSNNDKIKVLFDPKSTGGQGLTPQVYTKTNNPSVAADALARYSRNKVVKAILEHAELAKLHSTYVDPYLNGMTVRGREHRRPMIVKGRIHADFNQIGAATGRFSCRAPNLQNVPSSGSEMGKAIRGLFIAPSGCQLVVADFSQVELRVLAHFSRDARMLQAFLDGEDIHTATARALGVDRKAGKALNFAVVYGAGPEKVADMADASITEARQFLKLYDKQFPSIVRWKKEQVTECRRRKPIPYVRTLAGRIRYLPHVVSRDDKMRMGAERQVANTIVQGSAADIIKTAMVRAHRMLPADCRLILTVHDELVTVAPTGHADKAAEVIAEAMQGAWELSVPLPAEIAIVERWSDAK